MIQDISPYHLDNTFRSEKPKSDDYFFAFQDGNVLIHIRKDGCKTLPKFCDLQQPFEKIRKAAVFLFSINNRYIYLIIQPNIIKSNQNNIRYFPLCELKNALPKWVYFAGVTAQQFERWYEKNTFCGKCGGVTKKSTDKRALICPKCGNEIYPHIAPVVMAAVIKDDKLLMTKYACRTCSDWVLVSGFVELGETLEEAVKREVREETGIHIKSLRYFGSQPWGFSDSVIIGYIAEADGSDEIHIDTKELAAAEWHDRSALPNDLPDISIAYKMIEALRII